MGACLTALISADAYFYILYIDDVITCFRPNNKPFPLSTLGAVGSTQAEHDGCQAMLMGSYAAVAGGLFTYQSRFLQASSNNISNNISNKTSTITNTEANMDMATGMGTGTDTDSGRTVPEPPVLALIADEQLHPRRSNYNNQYNFWDPSGYFHIANLLASGEQRLIADARRILDTVAFAQNADSGQLPHHFNGATPVFTAISGATLPATNLFWLKAALRYVAETGDVAWLQSRLGVISNAGTFLLHQIPEGASLLSSSGALMIDVFKRSNFTLDANALAVDVFGLLSSMWIFLGNETAGGIYATAANDVTTALMSKLWYQSAFVLNLEKLLDVAYFYIGRIGVRARARARARVCVCVCECECACVRAGVCVSVCLWFTNGMIMLTRANTNFPRDVATNCTHQGMAITL